MQDATTPPARRTLVEQLRQLSELDSLQTALFQQAAAGRYGLGVTDMKALSILLRDGPMPAGALMAELHVTSGAVTGVINRLRDRGLVRRDTDDRDRRRAVVSADQDALRSGENVYLSIGAAFEELYASYSTAELEFLVRHLEASIAITRRETDALRRS